MEEGDLIHIDIPARILEIIGIKGQELSAKEVEQILEERRKSCSQESPNIKRAY